MRVSLFATCLGDQFFAEACADAVRLLRHLGVEVDAPAAQTCCGQPAYNAGHVDQARRMAEHTLDVFGDSDYVVLPSGSCTAMLRTGYGRLFGDHDGAQPGRVHQQVAGLRDKSFELTQFIVRVLGVEELGRGLDGRRVALHHGCHALRELGVSDEPETLLRGAGAEVATWEADRECCGFGGLFAVKQAPVSLAMADRKLDTLPADDSVDCITSSDGGCLLQMGSRATYRGVDAPVRHLASLLWEAVG